MKHVAVGLLLASASLSLVGCGEPPPVESPGDGGGGGGGSLNDADGGASTGGGAGASSLPVTVDWARVCPRSVTASNGKFCVIVPSQTDPAILDADPAAGPKLGFGYHVIGFPTDLTKIKGVWVHFTGSYGKPFDPLKSGTDLEKMNSFVWYNEVMGQGYIVIGLAYENQQSVNGDLCGTGQPGNSVNDCAGQVRREIIEGSDYSSLISVDAPNGVYSRLKKLFAFIEPGVQNFPAGITGTSIDWTSIMVSGHSQGTGHAYYLAKNVGVKGACFFAGPFDSPDTVNPDPSNRIADWFMAPGNLSNINKMGSFVVTSDPSYTFFTKGWGVIGLTKGTNWFEYDPHTNPSMVTDGWGAPINLLDPSNTQAAHGASVGAVEFAQLRAQACFR